MRHRICQGTSRDGLHGRFILAEEASVPLETWIVMHEDPRSDSRTWPAFDRLHRAMSAYAAGAEEGVVKP